MKNIRIDSDTSTWTPLTLVNEHDMDVQIPTYDIKPTDGIHLKSSFPQQFSVHNKMSKNTNIMMTNMARLNDMMDFDLVGSSYPEQFTTSMLFGSYPYTNTTASYLRVRELSEDTPAREYILGEKVFQVPNDDGVLENVKIESWSYIQDTNDTSIYFVVTLHDDYTCSISHDDNYTNTYLTLSGSPETGDHQFYFTKAPFDDPTDSQRYGYVINKKYGFMCLYKQFENDTYYIVNNVGTYSLDLQASTAGSYKDYPVPSVIRFIPYQKQTEQLTLNNNWVSYKTSGNQNELNISTTKSYNNVYNNYLMTSEYSKIKQDQLPVSFIQLKNQLTPEGNPSRGNPFPNLRDCDHREYFRVFKNNLIEDDNELFLGYDSFEKEIIIEPGTVTFFNTPQEMYPYVKLNVNDSNLIDAGAIGGDTPITSDKLFKRAADYKYNTPWGAPSDEETGIWLCTWLKSNIGRDWDAETEYRENLLVVYESKVYRALVDNVGKRPSTNQKVWRETNDAPHVWVDRYYNPEYFSAVEALEVKGQYYKYVDKFEYLIGALGAENHYVFDKISDLTFEPGCLYAYYRPGDVDDDVTISSLDFVRIHKGLEPILKQDRTPHVNTEPDLTLNGEIMIESGNIQSGDAGDFTVCFDLSMDDWSKPFASQLIGNYTNQGFGVFNRMHVTPYVIVPDISGVGIYNTDLLLLNHIPVENVSNVVKHAGNEDMTIVTKSGYSYKYDMNGMLIEEYNYTDFQALDPVPESNDVMHFSIDNEYYYMIDTDSRSYRYDINRESVDQTWEIYPTHIIGSDTPDQQRPDLVDPAFETFQFPYSEKTFIVPVDDYAFRINCDTYTIDNYDTIWYAKDNNVYKYSLSDQTGVNATWTGYIDESSIILQAEARLFGKQGNDVKIGPGEEIAPDGSSTLQTLINKWNDNNPGNTIQLLAGDPSVKPDITTYIQLSGGVDHGDPVTNHAIQYDKPYSRTNSMMCDYDGNVYLLYDNARLTKMNNDRLVLDATPLSAKHVSLEFQKLNECYMDLCTEFNESGYDNYIMILLRLDNRPNEVALLKLNMDMSYRSLNYIQNEYLNTVDLNKLTNITNYETNKQIYKNTINTNSIVAQMRYQNYFDSDKTELARMEVPVEELSPGYHSFAFVFNGDTSSFSTFIDGNLIATKTSDDAAQGGAYKFSRTIHNPLLVGSDPYFNNITMSEHLKKSKDYFVSDVKFDNYYIFNDAVNFYKLRVIARKNKQIQPLTLSLPAGKRNFIDHVTKFYKHQPRGFRSSNIDINITTPQISATDIQQYVTDEIINEITSKLPGNTNVNIINWVS